MLSAPRFFQAGTLGLITLCGTVVASDASAGGRHTAQTSHTAVTIQRETRLGSVSLTIGSQRTEHVHRDAHRGDRYERNDRNRYNDRDVRRAPQPVEYRHGDRHDNHRVVHRPAPQPTGYWKSVYHPPVYQTRYNACGYPYRVMVQAGHYDRVWVEYDHGHHHHHHH